MVSNDTCLVAIDRALKCQLVLFMFDDENTTAVFGIVSRISILIDSCEK